MEIVYWTPRGGFSERDLYHFTKEQLESWGCKFDRLVVGYTNIYGAEKQNHHLIWRLDGISKRIEEL